MNNVELKQLRRLFFLSISEASEFVSGVSTRTWEKWEKGDRKKTPQKVQDQMYTVLDRMKFMKSEKFIRSTPNFGYFDNFEDFKSETGLTSVVDWRLMQSISAQIYAEKNPH